MSCSMGYGQGCLKDNAASEVCRLLGGCQSGVQLVASVSVGEQAAHCLSPPPSQPPSGFR